MKRALSLISSYFRRKPEPELELYIRSATQGLERERDKERTIQMLGETVQGLRQEQHARRLQERNSLDELLSAMRMGGEGPWGAPKMQVAEADGRLVVQESTGPSASSQGAFGDVELALQNVGWRREINLSWLEFSRWGIQQIILISRLYYIKNPMIRRGTNIAAAYVFGRGCEVSSSDPAAQEIIDDFFARNSAVLGQNALSDLERRKWYDGNLFFAFFTDSTSGEVSVRMIDPVEILEIVSDPGDADTPWYYKRCWTEKVLDPKNATFQTSTKTAWYPALDYTPEPMPPKIGTDPIMWDSPVYHRRVGGVSKWKWGCPLVYPAIEWARAVQDLLIAYVTIRQSLAQFSMMAETKGGQQAMQGMKDQLSTTVGPSSSIWDQNPPTVAGGIFIGGPGTKLSAFNTSRAGGNPDDVRQVKLMVCMTFGLPESFFADMNTSNLATATSLDRPTELGFMARQEEWREDLIRITTWVLGKSWRAPGGQLREALTKRKENPIAQDTRLVFREAAKRRDKRGYVLYEKAEAPKDTIAVSCEFPTIIEADTPEMVKAIVEAMTLGSKQGMINGIDEKEGIRILLRLVGAEDTDEILEAMFPSTGPNAYDPLRTLDDPEAQNPEGDAEAVTQKAAQQMKEALRRLGTALRAMESHGSDSA